MKAWAAQISASSDDDSDEDIPPTCDFKHQLDLQVLIAHMAAAEPALQQIEGKDVVVILGNTGTGKSTLMHVLAGRELRKQSYKLADSSVEKTVYEAVEPLEGFAIGHSQKSQTKHFMHYVRPPCPPFHREVVFLDSAGFEDTAGMEVDIATAISLSKVAQACRTLRFVVLISCMSLLESRGCVVRSLVRLVSRLVGTAETEDFDKFRLVFTFLFTHTAALSGLRVGSFDNEPVGGNDTKPAHISLKLQSLLKDTRRSTETTEPALKRVLKWMQKCLKNELPYVGIFHPELTHHGWLLDATTQLTETDGRYTALGMEEGQRPQDAVKCGVSLHHERVVRLEVDQLAREFKDYLELEQLDQLLPVWNTIQLLFSHVDLQCVRHVHNNATTQLNDTILKVHRDTYEAIERGTDESEEEADQDIMLLLSITERALQKVSLIQQLGSFTMGDATFKLDAGEGTHVVKFLCDRLHRLADMVIQADSICKALRWHEKLAAWAQADQAFQSTEGRAQELFDRGHQALHQRIAQLLATSNSVFRGESTYQRGGEFAEAAGHLQSFPIPSSHEMVQYGMQVPNQTTSHILVLHTGELEENTAVERTGESMQFAVAAGHLQALNSNRNRMQRLGFCVAELDATWLRMEKHLEDMLASHAEGARRALVDARGNSHKRAEPMMPGDLEEHVHFLDTLVVSLINENAPSHLVGRSTDSLRMIIDEARNCVEEHAAVVDGTREHNSHSGPILSDHVAHMKSVVSVLNNVICEEQRHCVHSNRSYKSVLKNLVTAVRTQQTYLERLCEQMQQEMLRSTENHLQLMSTLISYAWLDSHLSLESQFVVQAVESLKRQYLLRHDTIRTQCTAHLEKYLESPTEQYSALGILLERFSEAVQLRLLCRSHVPTIVNKQHDLAVALGSTVRRWCSNQDCVHDLSDEIEHFGRCPLAVVNSVLMVCESLKPVEPAVEEVDKLNDYLLGWLRKSAKQITSLIAAGGQFKSKQSVLDTLLRCQEQGFLHLTKQLPVLADLQATIGKIIADQVRDLRKLISDSPDENEIDAALKDLADACCLDHHINQRASTELDSLTQLIEAKRAGLDKQLTENIQAFVFDGVYGHLKELSESKDAQNKLRFHNLVNVVNMTVKSKIALGEKQTDHGAKMADTYMMLKKAHECVGKILKDHEGVSISDAMKSLEQKVGDHAKTLINRLQSAQNEQDHPQIQKLVRVVNEYIQSTHDLLDSELIRNGRALLAKGLEFRSHFQSLVESFVSNLDKEMNDTRELHTSLGNWQRALSSQQVDPEERSEYETRMKWLGDNLNIKHKVLVEKIETDASFALGVHVYTFLSREWEKGLKAHVIGLQFNIAEVLESHKQNEHKENIKREMSFMDIKSETWKQELDALNRSWTRFGFSHTSEYTNRKQKLNKLMLNLLDSLHKRIDSGDYEQCGDSLNALTHRLEEFHSHIDGKGKLKQSLGQVKTRLLHERKRQEQSLAALLKDNHILEFTAAFRDYHKFIRHASVCEDNQNNGDVHKFLCNYVETSVHQLKQQLDSFDFENVCKLLKILRILGILLAGDFSSYVETRRMLKAKGDKWLQRLDVMQNQDFGGTRLKELAKHFSVLELDHDATQKDVESAFRRLSLKSHPDKPGGSNEKMRLLIEAKSALCNDGGLDKYNATLGELFSQDIRRIPKRLLTSMGDLLENSRYKCAYEMLQKLGYFELLIDLVSGIPSAEEIHTGVHEVVRGHVSTIRANVHRHWDARQFKKLHVDFTRLTSIDSNLSMFSEIRTGEWYTHIRRSVEEEINRLARKTMSYLTRKSAAFENIKEVAMNLIDLGRILDELPNFKNVATGKIHNCLQTCQDNRSWGVPFLFKLGMELERGTVGTLGSDGKVTAEDQRIGRVLVSEFKQFGDVLTWIWNEKVIQQDVESTVKDIVSKKVSGSRDPANAQINQQHLLQGFKEYEDEYNQWFHKWYAKRATLEDIAQTCRANAAQLRPCCTKTWNTTVRQRIPSLLGAIFAYYTISKSGNTYMQLAGETVNDNALMIGKTFKEGNNDSQPNIGDMLIKPHNIQIVSILRMLGYDVATSKERLVNHLMQIRTGEGKSMILGACSVILGLLGFNVRCICYSEYLSKRDRALFAETFSAFGVEGCIKYSTIMDYCDDTIRAKGDLRELTRDLLLGNTRACSSEAKSSYNSSSLARPQMIGSTFISQYFTANNPGSSSTSRTGKIPAEEILLVDEVDVFFGRDFYGKTRNHIDIFKTPESKAILESIWEDRSKFQTSSDHHAAVLESSTYSNMCKKFPAWNFLLEHEVKKMCRDVHRFPCHDYKFDRTQNRVGYKDMDGMDFHCCYGYLTTFAYCNEAAKGNLRDPEPTLRDQLGLHVSCGSYLYSDIKPACILGVSGTVEALGKYEWDVMNRYGIDIYTRMPSVYGKSNFHFLDQAGQKQVVVESTKEGYFREIADAANKAVNDGRAVIVFFDDNPMLKEYTTSTFYTKVVNKGILDETLSFEEKDYVIKKAATSGQATFTTAIFGRGTDFHCYDQQVLNKGGVHVIQAFLSESKMEEVQIQGRTARQGAEGTYSMVLLEEHLKKAALDITAESARCLTKPKLYDLLDKKRRARHEEACKTIEESLVSNTKIHRLTHEYFDALLAGDHRLGFELGKKLWLR